MRSRSTPRERPASASMRPQSAGSTCAAEAFSRSLRPDVACTGGSCAGSPRVGTPTGPRKLSTLNLSGTNGSFGGSLSYPPSLPFLFSFSPCSLPFSLSSLFRFSISVTKTRTYGEEKCICGICTCGRHVRSPLPSPFTPRSQ
jgi:hypothetical protein